MATKFIDVIRTEGGSIVAVWVWKFLYTPGEGWRSLSFYPDYEHGIREWWNKR
jgi:hypothetical protein